MVYTINTKILIDTNDTKVPKWIILEFDFSLLPSFLLFLSQAFILPLKALAKVTSSAYSKSEP